MNTEIEQSKLALGTLSKEVFVSDSQSTNGEASHQGEVASLPVKSPDAGEAAIQNVTQQTANLQIELKRIVERNQAKDLAKLVEEEEKKVSNDDQIENVEESHTLCQLLTELQTERRQLVDHVVELYASVGVGDKMNDYRRLIAVSCGMKVEQVDGVLDAIVQALNNEPQASYV